jgi:hypothetical protein
MSGILDQITLCTYNTGADMVREVLGDWLSFVGGRPRRVIVAVSPRDNVPPIYLQLQREGLIDQLLPVEARGRSVLEIDAEAVRLVIEAAPTEWALLVKLDTLPYRRGHDTWLADAFEILHRHGLFGLTGSIPLEDVQPLVKGYSVTRQYSNNFSLFHRADWINAVRSFLGADPDGRIASDPRFQGDGLRLTNEAAIESYLQRNRQRMLVRHESVDWSVFHVNVWGEALRRVRLSYLSRKGIRRFLKIGKPTCWPPYHPWDLWYGYPPPPILKRLRIHLGQWRRQLFRLQDR